MIFHENRLPTDDSHEISYLIFLKIRKYVAKFVVCCSRNMRFKGYNLKDSLNYEKDWASERLEYSKTTVKPVLSGHSKRRSKLVFKTDFRLIQI